MINKTAHPSKHDTVAIKLQLKFELGLGRALGPDLSGGFSLQVLATRSSCLWAFCFNPSRIRHFKTSLVLKIS